MPTLSQALWFAAAMAALVASVPVFHDPDWHPILAYAAGLAFGVTSLKALTV